MRPNSHLVKVVVCSPVAGSVVHPDSRPAFFFGAAGFTILVYHSDYYRTFSL
jgi:hypothetical protein